jgi:SAM-dependent methyltransferase
MALSLIPARRRGIEILDQPGVDPGLQVRSLSDVAIANRWFGGTRAVLAEVRRALPARGQRATLLDVGSGLGDIPRQARELARRTGATLDCVAIDTAEALARASGAAGCNAVRGDARALPFADGSVDVVTCSQVLHHFTDDEAVLVLRELDRVARVRVIVADLRRSWLAAAGIWTSSWALGFHPVSRHDGVVSVLRGFTARELAARVNAATGRAPEVRRRLGFRVTASWAPATAAGATPAGPGAGMPGREA